LTGCTIIPAGCRMSSPPIVSAQSEKLVVSQRELEMADRVARFEQKEREKIEAAEAVHAWLRSRPR